VFVTKDSLAVLEGLKHAQVIEDGMVYLDLVRQLAVSANEDGPCLEFDISPYDTCIGSILAALGEEGLIRPWEHEVGYYHVTHKGWHYHSQLEQMRHQQAQQERQQRFENKVSVLSLLIPLITFLGGLLLEYHVGIISFIGGLFH